MRHLAEYDIRMALGRGKAAEQFLGGAVIGDCPIIRTLEITPKDGQFCLTYHERMDEGSDSFHDLYEFSYAIPDEDPPTRYFNTLEEALACSVTLYHASASRWVNQFVIQDEYADYRRAAAK